MLDRWSETTLRGWALAAFAADAVASVGVVLVARGLHGQPPLVHDDGNVQLSDLGLALALGLVGLALTWVRPRNPIGWLLSLAGLLLAVCDLGQYYGQRTFAFPDENLPLGTLALSLSAPLWLGTVFIPASLLLVRYPSGTIHGRWPRRFERLVLVGFTAGYLAYAGSANSVTDEVEGALPPVLLPDWFVPILGVPALVGILGGTLLIVGDAVRRVARGEGSERTALLLLLTTSVIAALITLFGPVSWLAGAAFFAVLLALAVGVVRYQALGIEVVLRRTIVYAVLTGLVLLVFVVGVSGLARLVPTGQTPQLVAAVVIAVGLAPARERVNIVVDRVLFGARRDPSRAVRELATAADGGTPGGFALSVVESLAHGLRVPGCQLRDPDGELLASTGLTGPSPVAVPLLVGGHRVGELLVQPRAGESSLATPDRHFLETVAPMVAAVLRASRLAEELTDERNRVVATRSEERDRLRRELHDGLGPSLTGIALGLEAAQGRDDPALLARLREEVTASLEEIRRIIDDLQPSALDGGDLLGAVTRRVELMARGSDVEVHLRVPDHLPDLAPDVLRAAWRILDEALTNVVRHAEARHCWIMIEAGPVLGLQVQDDGCGVGPGRSGGVGLGSMRERAVAVGGRLEVESAASGTTVTAELPVLVEVP